ncbi:MAG: tetratricopeptide repeat protein [Alphaproteobacteria bacterium]|nr:tetratricopeptide repeat protein [Alphaproteobacteria bacterium]
MEKLKIGMCAALVAGLFAIAPAHASGGGGGGMPMPSGSDESDMKPSYRNAVKLVKAKRYQEAIVMLEDLLKDDPHNPDIMNYLGFSYRKLGYLDNSAAYYKAALTVKADHLGALEYQGELFLMQNDVASAEGNLARLASLCGDCDEYDDLKDAIEDYKENHPA